MIPILIISHKRILKEKGESIGILIFYALLYILEYKVLKITAIGNQNFFIRFLQIKKLFFNLRINLNLDLPYLKIYISKKF
jgi:hypothetical protein